MFIELPLINTSTPADRLQALKDAKDLMSKENATGLMAAFGAPTKADPGSGNEVIDGFIRLAEYITTGHDYRDTHPTGKKRPKVTQVHMNILGGEPSEEDLEHILHHLNEDLPEFLKQAEQDQRGRGEDRNSTGS